MACRQYTRPSPARVAISRIEKAWLREARKHHDTPIAKNSGKQEALALKGYSASYRHNTRGGLPNLRTVVGRQLIELLDDVQRLPLDRPRHPRNTWPRSTAAPAKHVACFAGGFAGGRVSRVPRSMEREALNVVQELCKLSAHSCSKVLGVLLELCDGRTPNTP